MPSIPITLIQQFLHPPLGVMGLQLITGSPLGAGTHVLTRPAGPVGVDAFGILYSVVLEPPGVGSTVGESTIFELRVVQAVVHHQMLTSEMVISQVLEGFRDSDLLLFQEAIPHDVTLFITTGFSIDVFWVLVA